MSAADLPPAVSRHTGDARDIDTVARVAATHDVVVTATRPAMGDEDDLLTATKALIEGTTGTGARLVAVGGAATLTVPGTDHTVLDDPAFLPPAYRPIARACAGQLELYRQQDGLDWTYLSPPALLQPGERTGRYRLGTDELVVDGQGRSAISMEDLAVVLLDEIEQPRHRGMRFTAAY